MGGDISVVVTRCLKYFHGRLVQPTAGLVSIDLLMIGMCQVVPLGCPMISVCVIYPLLHEYNQCLNNDPCDLFMITPSTQSTPVSTTTDV